MKFDGKVLNDPYPCDPSDSSKQCQIFFDTSGLTASQYALINRTDTSHVKVGCRCTLGNNTLGVCGSVIGHTTYYQNALAAY